MNDRDQPRWVGYVAAGIFTLFTVAVVIGLDLDPRKMTSIELALFVTGTAFAIWIFIDNGLLKGTPGTNQYGPYPGGPGDGQSRPATSVVQGARSIPGIAPPRPRRSLGAYARDAVVGLFVVAAAAGFDPTQSLVSAIQPAVHNFLRPNVLKEADDFWDNKVAVEAWEQALEARKSGDYEAALRHMNRVVELHEPGLGAARALRERAGDYRSLGRLREALGDVELAVEMNPGSAIGFSLLGEIRNERGDGRGALAAYDEALRIDPDDASAQLALGELFHKLGRSEEGITAFTHAIDAATRKRAKYLEQLNNPKYADRTYLESWVETELERLGRAYVARATLYRDTGNDIQALADYDAALAEIPDFALAYAGRGWLHEMQGKIDHARADYERVLEFEPNDEWAGQGLAKLGQPDRRSFALWQKGNIYRAARRYDESQSAYGEAIRFDPRAPRPYAERGWLHFQTGAYGLAIADETQALERDPKYVGAHSIRGAAHLQAGELEQALADLNESLRRKPSDTFALGYRGRVHEARGDTALARADYQAAAILDPHDSLLKELLQRLN